MQKQSLFKVRRAGGKFNQKWRLLDCWQVESFIRGDKAEQYQFGGPRIVRFVQYSEADARALQAQIQGAFPYRTTVVRPIDVLSGNSGQTGHVLSHELRLRQAAIFCPKRDFPAEKPVG